MANPLRGTTGARQRRNPLSAFDGVLKEACAATRTPYVRVNRGRLLQCLLHLERELGPQPAHT